MRFDSLEVSTSLLIVPDGVVDKQHTAEQTSLRFEIRLAQNRGHLGTVPDKHG
jgi:hypothetical protein